MLLFTLLLTIAPASSMTPSSTTLLKFDRLNTTSAGLAPLLSPYHHLAFSSSFSVFSPHSPALSYLITPNDLNCAPSAPNALLGSRAWEGGPGATFEIANATGLKAEGLEGHFTLEGMKMKGLDAPEPGTRIEILGYKVNDTTGKGDGEVLEWGVFFPAGFHDMFEVKIEEFSGVRWDGLWKVEMKADIGEDTGRADEGLDWEFCVDDLAIGFPKTKDKDALEGGDGEDRKQAVLGEGKVVELR